MTKKEKENIENAQLGVRMGGGHHLRKVNQNWGAFFLDENIELVKVAVNEAVSGQAYDKIHQIRVEFSRVENLFDLPPDMKAKK